MSERPDERWPIDSFAGSYDDVCIFGVVSQFFQTKTYSFLPAAIASAFGLTSVVWSFCFDVLLFNKPFGAVQAASYFSFILAVGILVYLRNAQRVPA
jgi:drug/metabolite transporter (DMT)-like permease